MHIEGIRVINVLPIRQYVAITIPEDIFPEVSLEHRTLIMLNEMTVIFFNDGMLSFLRPN